MIVAGFTTEINTHILSTESWLVCCQCPLFVSILFDLMIIFASTRQISNEISVWVAWFFFIEYICDAKEQNGLGIGSKRVHYLFASCLLWMPLGLWINKMIFFLSFFRCWMKCGHTIKERKNSHNHRIDIITAMIVKFWFKFKLKFEFKIDAYELLTTFHSHSVTA